MGQKIDTQAVGLDIGLSFVKWLTGAENMHYGLWDGLDVNAGNLGTAQAAYTEKLFALLPAGKLKILDIGGGAGETARKLLALGHSVDIVVPSPFLASRCRDIANGATVHEMIFEDFTTDQSFDLCLFSESYQYIPLDQGLPKALSLVKPGGTVIVSDVFRRDAYFIDKPKNRVVGGGHQISKFRAMLETLPASVAHEEDITDATAPSIDIESGLFHVLGFAYTRTDQALATGKPKLWAAAKWMWRRVMSAKRREKLDQRLNGDERTSAMFSKYNVYLMLKITKT